MSPGDAALGTPDGAEIAYRYRPGRNPIVLLHGLGLDASMWDGVLAAWPAERGVLVPEMRGHGGSTLGWRTPSVDLWAEDVARLLDREKIERPAVAGLSMGGYVAFALEATHRGRSRALAFLSTTAAPDDDPGRERRAAGIATIRRRGWRAFAEEMVSSLLNREDERFAVNSAHVMAMFERAGDTGLPQALMALASRPDRRPMLASIRVPCIAAVGSADAITPPERAREIAGGIPGARLDVLDGAAHLLALERPREVAALLDTL